MIPILGYWDIRGLGEPVRYMLHYLGVEFQDKRYVFGPEPNFFDTEWNQEHKQALGLALPNLPYFIDGDVKITQSLAIMRYLSRTHGGLYYPDSGNDVTTFEMVEGHVRDITSDLVFLAYSSNFDNLLTECGSRFKDKVATTSEFLGDNNWIMGETLSHVDFLLFEALDTLNFAYPGIYREFCNLVKFVKRFSCLPGVEKYRSTSKKWPLYSPMAYFGGKGVPPCN